MTLGLAIMMIVLLGVMGAGLLTFVSRDLSTVVEENRGQRAFEVADAGVGAAKRQLTADVQPTPPAETTTTTLTARGLPLVGGERRRDPKRPRRGQRPLDNVNVTIDYRCDAGRFQGRLYGQLRRVKRKIEAIFKGTGGGGTGTGIGLPSYYTPSAIRVEDPLTLNGQSLFSQSDILIKGLSSTANFITDYETGALPT